MPYIITITNPREIARIQGYYDREPRRFGKVGTWDEPLERVKAGTSRAVATLDIRERRDLIEPDVLHNWPSALRIIGDIPESGGTIMLPDGTVIEVEPCDRFYLLRALGRDEHSSVTTDEIIDAYNAAQS